MADNILEKIPLKPHPRRFLRTAIDYLVKFENASIIILFIFMTIVTLLQVLFRYVFKISAPWTEEVGRYLMIWLIFIGAAWAIHAENHIGINVIDIMIKNKKIIRLIDTITALILVVFSCYYFYSASIYIPQVYRSNEMTIATGIPMWIPQFCLLLGGFLIVLHCVELFCRKLAVLLKGGM